MAHTWNIASMDYTVSQDGHTNVVNTVHWRCFKFDENENSGSVYGTVALEAPGETFIEWENITEEIALGWAKAALGAEEVAALEGIVDAQIAEKATPTHGSGVSWAVDSTP